MSKKLVSLKYVLAMSMIACCALQTIKASAQTTNTGAMGRMSGLEIYEWLTNHSIFETTFRNQSGENLGVPRSSAPVDYVFVAGEKTAYSETISFQMPSGDPNFQYEYKVTVNQNGTAKLSKVSWDYSNTVRETGTARIKSSDGSARTDRRVDRALETRRSANPMDVRVEDAIRKAERR